MAFLLCHRRLLHSGLSQRSKALRRFLQRRADRVEVGSVTMSLDGGLRLRLDLSLGNQRSIFWAHDEYEPALQWILRELLPESGLMIDCGANAGLFGFLALARPQTRVIFIEPHPRLAAQLRQNVALNRLENRASIVECAASDSEGKGELIQAIPSQDGSHSLHSNKYSDAGATTIAVRLRRLDDILKDIGHIDLLKIDAEFHDLQVIEGLGDFFGPQRIGMVYVEMSYDQFEPCFEKLSAAGYTPFGTRKLRQEMRRGRTAEQLLPYLFERFGETSRRRDLLWCAPDSPAARRLLERLSPVPPPQKGEQERSRHLTGIICSRWRN